MVHNLCQEMMRDGTVERYLKPYEGQVLTKEVIQKMVHTLVHDNYLTRARGARLTGEWIVFSKTSAGNFYLALANHLEGDKQIWNRIEAYKALDRLLPPIARYEADIEGTGETDLPSPAAEATHADGPALVSSG
jgi:hypothetical protein